MTDFIPFRKIPRLSRKCVVTEKIDGTNAQIYIGEDGEFLVGSKKRWITPQDDNFGFARWAYKHKEELLQLGPGHHFGEWWGNGIQRGYGLANGDKRFSLFNTQRWGENRPSCCDIVPVIDQGIFDDLDFDWVIADLALRGSRAVPGFMRPEGIVVYHIASNTYFKKTIERDEYHKGE